MLADAVIGREAELGEIRACLAACAEGPAGLALVGEPGIGKTVLWEAGVAEARARGFRVLVHRSVQAEAGFAFAGLSDLVGPLFEDVAEELAPPRRQALEVALLLSEAGEASPPPNAIGVALLDVLRALSRDAPVLVALDDLQWLDESSASVLPAALRRLDTEPVALLATARGTAAALRAWEPAGVLVRRLSGLGIGDLQELLRERLGIELARPQLARLHEISGGNPYFALELARAPDGRVPESLRDVLGGRVASLPARSAEVLLLAAALARPTEQLVCAAHGDAGAARVALEAAGDVLVDDAGRLRFAHPLLASLCYERATPSRRRAAHRQLAAVVGDVEERARHLALASTEPDAATAAELEVASTRAAARGAAVAAVELADLGAANPPRADTIDLRRRRLSAGRLQWLAGDLARATAIHEELVASMPPGPDRAEVLYVMALSGGRRFAERAALCEQGITEAGEDPRAIELYAQLGLYRWFTGDTVGGLAATREGLLRAERLGDPRLVGIAQAHVGYLETWSLDITPGLLERGARAEASIEPPLPFYQSPRLSLAAQFVYCGDPARGRAILEDCLREDREGAEHTRSFVYFFLPYAEWLLGRWRHAHDYARLLREYTAQAHDPDYGVFGSFLSGLVEADRGLFDAARRYAEDTLRTATSLGDVPYCIAAEALLGHVDVVAGDVDGALRRLRPLPDRMLRTGNDHGMLVTTWADTIEMLVLAGERDEAAIRLAQYETIAPRARGSHLMSVVRVRALLAAAQGNITAAEAALDDALASAEAVTFPYERARALLMLGAVRRQAQRRRDARAALVEAAAVFDALGATPWIARTQDELGRLGGRPRADDELTEAERRVAALAAAGLRNREIAARLVIDVRTVETHLSRTYRKLGVRSRSELAARVASQAGTPTKV
jgi:DNA-binding CsgD family transcriptional regulator